MTSSQSRPDTGYSNELWRFALLVAIAFATLTIYAPVKQDPFIGLDDRGYVVHNTPIQHLNWDTVKWAFTTFHASNWHPLTWLSHAVDFRLFALEAGRHHEVNLLLHAVNAMLLFWLLAQATGCAGRSFAVAALFALHPINVESVAWIAERKNLLSMFFFLLALVAYRWYASQPRIGRYLCVALWFALGLMSKPQVITLPLVLLLWDYWPLRRMSPDSSDVGFPKRSFRSLVREKLPLVVLSVASAIVTVMAQRAGGTMGGLNSYSVGARLGNAIVAYVRYLGEAFWPARLAFFYPHTKGTLPLWQIAGSALLLLLITWFAWSQRRHRYLPVGWLWFLGTLVPMIGLVQVGTQAIADRYAYLPFVGLFIAICWGIADAVEHWPLARVWLPAGAVAILAVLSLVTRHQLSYWSDDLTLWTHSAEVVKDNWMAENMIGERLVMNGDPEGAEPHFRAAAEMEPLFPFPHLHIGIYEEEHGHSREAIQQLQQVIDLTQKDAAQTPVIRTSAFVHLSIAYNQLGDFANQQKFVDLAARSQQLR